MPIYEYRCKSCNHVFEHIHFTTSDPVPPCPECNGNEVEKIISAGTVKPEGFAGSPTYSFPTRKLP